MPSRVLTVEIVGNAGSLERALGKAAVASKGFGDKVASVGRSISKTGKTLTRDVTLPIVGIGIAATKMALTFDDKMRQVQTQAGASSKEVSRMHDYVLKLAQTSGDVAGPNQLADALYRVESAGIRGGEAMRVLKAADDLATVGHANLEQATYGLVSAVKSGIDGAQNYAQAIGTMNATVGEGNMRMDDLTAAFSTGILPMAKQAGISLAEVGAALDVFTNRGKPAQQSATGLTRAFAQMMSPTKAATGSLADMGIGADQLAQDLKSGGLVKAVMDLKTHFDAMPNKIRAAQDVLNAFGRSKGGAQMLLLVQNAKALSAGLDQVKAHAAGFGSALAATQNEAETKVKAAWASIQASLIRVGEDLAPVAAKVAQFLAKIGNAFASLSPQQRQFIEKIAGIAAVAGPAMIAIGKITTAIARVGQAIKLVMTADLGPFGIALAGIAAIVGTLWWNSMAKAASAADSFTSAVNRAIGATQRIAGAFRNVGQASRDLTSAHLGVKGAVLAAEQAHQSYLSTLKQLGPKALDTRQAYIAWKQSLVDVGNAQQQVRDASSALTAAEEKHTAAINSKVQAQLDSVSAYNSEAEKEHEAIRTIKDLTAAYGPNLDKLDKTGRGAAYLTQKYQEANAVLKNGRAVSLDYASAQTRVANEAGKAAASAAKMGDSKAAAADARVRSFAQAAAQAADRLHRIPTVGEVAAQMLRDKLPAGARAAVQALGTSLGKMPGIGHKNVQALEQMILSQVPTLRGQGMSMGDAITTGTLNAVSSLGIRLSASLSSQIMAAIAHAKAVALQAHSPSKRARDHLGKPIGEGTILGAQESLAGLRAALASSIGSALNAEQAALAAKRGGFKAEWARLTLAAVEAIKGGSPAISAAMRNLENAALSAFDSATQAGTARIQARVDKQVQQIKQRLNADLSTINKAYTNQVTQNDAASNALAAKIQQQQRQHDLAAAQQNVAGAQQQLAQDQQSGADQTTLQADQQAIDEAQYQLQQLQEQYQLQDEQAQAKTADTKAKAERDKATKLAKGEAAKDTKSVKDQGKAEETRWKQTREAERKGLQAYLKDVQTGLDAVSKAWKEKHQLLIKEIGGKMTADMKVAGTKLVDAFNTSVQAGMRKLQAFLKSLGLAIGDYVSGGGSVPGHAEGAIVPATPGGLYRVAEGGFPETIISHDPSKRGRQLSLWAQTGKILGVPGFANGGVNPTTGLADTPAMRASAMFVNDYGNDKYQPRIAAGLIGSIGPRAQAEAAVRHTYVDGVELHTGAWRAPDPDPRFVALLTAAYPGLVFESGSPGQQISAGQALSRISGGIGAIQGYAAQSVGITGSDSPLERITSHAIHFADGYLTDAKAAAASLANSKQYPHLRAGGITTRDTLAQLHAHEAVIPLPPSFKIGTSSSGGLGLGGGFALHIGAVHLNGTDLSSPTGRRQTAKLLIDEVLSEAARRSKQVKTLGLK